MMIDRAEFYNSSRPIGHDVGLLMLVLVYNIQNGTLPFGLLYLPFFMISTQLIWSHIDSVYSYLSKVYKDDSLSQGSHYDYEFSGIIVFVIILSMGDYFWVILIVVIIYLLIHGYNLSNVPLFEIVDIDEDNITLKFLEPVLGKLFSIRPIIYSYTLRRKKMRYFNILYYQLVNLALLLFYMVNLIIPGMNYEFNYVDLMVSATIVISVYLNLRGVYSRYNEERVHPSDT